MITLVLGGTRSGKSHVAEAITEALAAVTGAPVTYIATAAVDPGDADHIARVAAHRDRRPDPWDTLECGAAGDLAGWLRTVAGVVLVDSIGTWVTLHDELVVHPGELLDALVSRVDPTVLVSEEVGLAVHPPSELGRRYVDAMGTVNRAIAEVADRAVLVVAGRVVELSRFDPGVWLQAP